MKKSKIFAGLAATAALLGGVSSIAFKPNDTGHGHRMITSSILLGGYSYGGHVVPAFSTTLSDGKIVQFASNAAQNIVEGVKSNDDGTNVVINGLEVDLPGELRNPVAHCDNDRIEACSELIRSRRFIVRTLLKNYLATGNITYLGLARGYLGKALHTLQDFYAHSNHADVNTGGETFDALTGYNVAAIGMYAHSPTVSVCDARAPTFAWVAFPTWGNNGGNWQLTGAGLTKEKYTTGWFENLTYAGQAVASDTPGKSRCDHGTEASLDIRLTGFRVVSGISKDVPYSPLDDKTEDEKEARIAGGQPTEIHSRASYQAALHTRKFLETVIAAIKPGTSTADQDKMISALLGVETETPVYGFVIDRTGSMSSIIGGVKTQIQKLIDESVLKGGDAATRKFMVVDYGDPDVSPTKIGLAADIKTYLNTVVASGGGDCPESTNHALKQAVADAPKNSNLFVFTDASSNDGALAAEVLAAAQAKKIVISYAASGSCSPIDPSYYLIANGTGGQVILTDHTAAGAAAAFTGISIDSSGATAQPVVIESGVAATARTVSMPVEDGATRLSVLVNSSSGTIEFKSPSGVVVPSAEIIVNDFIGGRGLKVQNPIAGNWTVTLNPVSTTTYSIKADVVGAVELNSVTFTTLSPQGRSGHEGYANYIGSPPLGKSRVEVVLKGAAPSPVFDAVSLDGSVLATMSLSRVTDSIYAGEINLGTTPFRLRASGKTAAGAVFMRILPTLYTTEPFKIELADASQWAKGIVGELRVKITNHAEDDNFTIAASAPTAGTVQSVTPATLTIKKGESALVAVKLAVSATADVAVRHTLRVDVTNGAAVAFPFSHTFPLELDTDGDGIPDSIEQGPAGADPTYDGNGDGIPDWQQANVASLLSRQKAGYVTMAIPAPAKFEAASSIAPIAGSPSALPLDLFDFKITGLQVGGSVTMKLYMPDGLTAGSYLKYGPEKGNAIPHWYDFKYDENTGATINSNVITLKFVDGGRGDDDLTANGVIVDAGGPAAVVVAGVAAPQDPPVPASTASTDSGGGSGGCTVGDPAQKDGSLLILSGFALFILLLRAVRR